MTCYIIIKISLFQCLRQVENTFLRTYIKICRRWQQNFCRISSSSSSAKAYYQLSLSTMIPRKTKIVLKFGLSFSSTEELFHCYFHRKIHCTENFYGLLLKLFIFEELDNCTSIVRMFCYCSWLIYTVSYFILKEQELGSTFYFCCRFSGILNIFHSHPL